MTNINCSLDCKYQTDGKCSYDKVKVSEESSALPDCPYRIKETKK